MSCMRKLHTAVFSRAKYNISIRAYSFTGDDIISMQLVRSADPLPIKGIVKSELTLVLNTSTVFDPNSAVKISVSGAYSMNFATHYISKISRKGNRLTIKALDRMKRLDCDFDDSTYNRSDEPFNTSLVIANLANQAGLDGVLGSMSAVTTLYYDEIHNKTCREILDLISENEVGVWYCTNDNSLRFQPFCTVITANAANMNNTSALYLHSVKGPFEGLCAVNSESSEVFTTGSTGNFSKVLKVKGSRMCSERAVEILSNVANKSYQAYACAHIGLTAATEGLTAFVFDDYPDGLISCKTTVYFGGCTIYASASAADISEGESDYSELDYNFRKQVEEGKLYGCCVMSQKGIAFVSPDDYSDSQLPCTAAHYSFTTQSGGITSYEGVMVSTAPESVQRVSDNEVIYNYENYSIRVTADGEGDTRTNPTIEAIYNE